MCLPLSDSALTSRGDRRHIPSDQVFLHSWLWARCRAQLCTHGTTKEPWIKILCPQKQLLHLLTPCLCVCVWLSHTVDGCVLLISLNHPLCDKKPHCCLYYCFMNNITTNLEPSLLLILLISDARLLRQQAPGTRGEQLRAPVVSPIDYYWICTKIACPLGRK